MAINETRIAAQTNMSGWVSRHPIASFFMLAYALSWLAWLLPAIGYQGTIGLVALHVGGFGPALAPAIITWYSGESVREWARSIIRWRVRPHWYLVALGLPILLLGVASIGFALLGHPIDAALIPDRLVAYLPMLIYMALLQGGNEEPGWRGFALPRLQDRYAPVPATFLLGVIWAFWHLPLLAANPETQHGTASMLALLPVVLVTLVNMVALTYIYTWIYNRTQSVLFCILLHASMNTTNALLIPLPNEALQGDIYQTLNLVMTGVNVVVAIILVAVTRGRLGYDSIKNTNRVALPTTRSTMTRKGKAP